MVIIWLKKSFHWHPAFQDSLNVCFFTFQLLSVSSLRLCVIGIGQSSEAYIVELWNVFAITNQRCFQGPFRLLAEQNKYKQFWIQHFSRLTFWPFSEKNRKLTFLFYFHVFNLGGNILICFNSLQGFPPQTYLYMTAENQSH